MPTRTHGSWPSHETRRPADGGEAGRTAGFPPPAPVTSTEKGRSVGSPSFLLRRRRPRGLASCCEEMAVGAGTGAWCGGGASRAGKALPWRQGRPARVRQGTDGVALMTGIGRASWPLETREIRGQDNLPES